MQKLAIYLHIPFCLKKCPYCDFTSYVDQENQAENYHHLIQKEIALRIETGIFFGVEATSIYFGGGTPTLLKAPALGAILASLKQNFKISRNCEITLEANPGSKNLDRGFLTELREKGFNRISLGGQSFNDVFLEKIGRIHKAADIIRAISLSRQSGFDNLSLDLIYGLPGQSLKEWEKDLLQAIELRPEHISTYNLTLEKGTIFFERWGKKKIKLPSEKNQLKMYELAISHLLKAGYEHYEISNFAFPGRRSRHNQVYWMNGDYLGFGVGASSYINGERFTNTRDVKEYIDEVSQGKFPVGERERIFGKKLWGETLMLGLRRIEGVSIKDFESRFCIKFFETYSPVLPGLLEEKLIVLDGGNLRLTHKGLIFSNEVFGRFLED